MDFDSSVDGEQRLPLVMLVGALSALILLASQWGVAERQGRTLLFLIVLAGLALAAGLLTIWLGRRPGWISPLLGPLWLIAVVSIPFLTGPLDAHPVALLAVISWLLLLGLGASFWLRSDARRKLTGVVLVAIPFAIILMAMVLGNTIERLGPLCTLGSALREQGCVRSVPLPVLHTLRIVEDPISGEEWLLRPDDDYVVLEPIERWPALLAARAYQVASGRSFNRYEIDVENAALHVYGQALLAPPAGDARIPGLVSLYGTVEHTVLDLATGARLDSETLDLSDPERVQEMVQGLQDYYRYEAARDDVRLSAHSPAGWLAVANRDGEISVWSTDLPAADPSLSRRLPLGVVPEPMVLPSDPPEWGFSPERTYRCLDFSPDGSLLVGVSDRSIDIYDRQKQSKAHTITLPEGRRSELCPRFHPASSSFAISTAATELSQRGDRFESDREAILIIDAGSGTVDRTIALDFSGVFAFAFAADSPYLAVTIHDIPSQYGRTRYQGLIFDLSSERPDR